MCVHLQLFTVYISRTMRFHFHACTCLESILDSTHGEVGIQVFFFVSETEQELKCAPCDAHTL